MKPVKFFTLIAVFIITTACSTLGSNVSGNWSCGRDQGKGCPTTHKIDERVLAEQNDITLQASVRIKRLPDLKLTAGSSFDDDLSDISNNELPARTADQIGRIVIMPFADAYGTYHVRAVVYAVMEEGGWKSSPDKPVIKNPVLRKPVFSKLPFQKSVLEKPDLNKNAKK